MRKRDGPVKKLLALVQKSGTMNIILFLVGAFFVWFNWQMILTFRECGSIPESYACAVVAATIGECGICGWIRTNKDRQRDREYELQDREHNEELMKRQQNAAEKEET